MITALDKVDPAVRAIKSGAAEYLVKPVTPEALHHAVNRALMTRALLAENAALKRHLSLIETGQRHRSPRWTARGWRRRRARRFLEAVAVPSGVLLWSREATGPAGGLRGRPGGGAAPPGRPLRRRAPGHAGAPLRRRVAGGARQVLASRWARPARHRGWAPARDPRDGRRDVARDRRVPGAPPGAGAAKPGPLRARWRTSPTWTTSPTSSTSATWTRCWSASAARSRPEPFSLLFLDLDYFKSVNDTHGHLVGCKLLVEVARVLKACVRDKDVVAR